MKALLCHASFALVNAKSIIHSFNYSELTSLVSTLGLECIFYNNEELYIIYIIYKEELYQNMDANFEKSILLIKLGILT